MNRPQQRGDYDQALDWYHKSLTIEEELGNRAGTATSYHQLGILYTETGQAADAVGYNVRSMLIRHQLGSPEIHIDLRWLGRQREILGPEEFRRLLGEHLSPEDLDTVIGWIDQSDEQTE